MAATKHQNGGKGDLRDCECTTTFKVYREWSKEEKISSESCGRKRLVDARGHSLRPRCCHINNIDSSEIHAFTYISAKLK